MPDDQPDAHEADPAMGGGQAVHSDDLFEPRAAGHQDELDEGQVAAEQRRQLARGDEPAARIGRAGRARRGGATSPRSAARSGPGRPRSPGCAATSPGAVERRVDCRSSWSQAPRVAVDSERSLTVSPEFEPSAGQPAWDRPARSAGAPRNVRRHRRVGHLDPATVALDDPLGDRQAQPGASGRRAGRPPEPVEDTGQVLRPDPLALVLHRQDRSIPVVGREPRR